MMDFAARRPRRERRENIVPMINVVFLLLIFFLMSAQIAPQEPFEVALPKSAGTGEARAQDTLYVSATGTLYLNGVTGAAVYAEASGLAKETLIRMHADADLPARQLAQIMQQLGQAGVTQIQLATGGI